MTLFAFSCELPLLPKGLFLITPWICIFLTLCSALHSLLWISSCCFTEAHRNLLSLWLQPSERLVLVLSWAKRLRELQTNFSSAHAKEHVFVLTASYGIMSHCSCLHKKWNAKTPWLQICVTVLKNQVKNCLRICTVVSMQPPNKPLYLDALYCLLPYSKPRMSTFQINTEIPHIYCQLFFKTWQLLRSPPRGDRWGIKKMLLQLPLVVINSKVHGAASVIFYEETFQ